MKTDIRSSSQVVRQLIADQLFGSSILSWTLSVLCCLSLTACPAKRTPLPDHTFITALASTRIMGDDHLGLLSRYYDAKGAARAHKPFDTIGLLDWSFGSDLTNLRDFLSIAQVSWIRVHILNTTCVRNGNCGTYEPGHGYNISSFDAAVRRHDAKILKYVRDRVGVYKDFFLSLPAPYPVAISPALEHNLSTAAYRILADEVVKVWPVQLVNSAMSNKGEAYRGAWVETHGKGGYSYSKVNSTDGVEIMDIDSVKYAKNNANNILTLRWSRRNNCRAQGNFVDPRKRTSCLNGRQADQQVHSTESLGSPPRQNFSCTSRKIDSRDIWKTLGGDKGNGDSRANLPVFIPSGFNSSGVTLVSSNGSRVGTLGYYGPFTDGRPRFYSGWSSGSKLTGYEFQKRAGGFVWAKQGSRCIGPFIPGRRQGDYR